MSNMDPQIPRFHVLIGTTLGAPWEGDVDAANVCDALDEGLRLYLGGKRNVGLARQVLIRRLPDSHG